MKALAIADLLGAAFCLAIFVFLYVKIAPTEPRRRAKRERMGGVPATLADHQRRRGGTRASDAEAQARARAMEREIDEIQSALDGIRLRLAFTQSPPRPVVTSRGADATGWSEDE